VAIDSAFAPAWGLLSVCNAFIYWQHWEQTPRRLELARSAMERATALQPDAPETHLARGYYRYWAFRDYSAALDEFEAALRSRPEDADILQAIGLVQRRQGRWADALATLDHASQLEPRGIGLIDNAAETACIMRRYSLCARYADRMIRIAPEDWQGYFSRGRAEALAHGDRAVAGHMMHEGLKRGRPAASARTRVVVLRSVRCG
jgi:tetratricopeptide (TPR) repeat protein